MLPPYRLGGVMNFSRYLLIISVLLLSVSCGGGGESTNGTTNTSTSSVSCSTSRVCSFFGGGCSTFVVCLNSSPPEPVNTVPTASLAAPETAVVGASFVIDSTAADPENDPLNYNWAILSKPSSSSLTIADSTVADLVITPDVFGRYVFGLVVDDGDLFTETQYAMVDVENPTYKDFTLTTDILFSSFVGSEPSKAIAGKLNNDTDPDLLLGQCDGTVTTYLNNGMGGFTFGDNEAAHANCNPALVIADFNADNINDVASYNVVLEGDGAGGLAPMMTFGFTAANVVAGDFNGDNKMDLALVKVDGSNYSIVIMHSNGDGSFTQAVEFPLQDFGAITVADFNKDNADDLVFFNMVFDANGDSQLSMMLGDTSANYTSSQIDLPGNGAMGTGDIDGDGNLDLVISYFLGILPDTPPGIRINVDIGIATYLGNGDGTFATPIIQSAANTSYSELSIYDFTEDGNADLVYLGDNEMINVLEGDGTGGYNGLILIKLATHPTVNGFFVSEIDGDNRPDMIIASRSDFTLPNQLEIAYGKDNHLP